MKTGNAKGHKVLIDVREEKGVEKPDKIHGEKSSRAINQKLLYRTTGHPPFRSFGGVDDGLTKPLTTLIS